MTQQTIRNPYEDELPSEEFSLSRCGAWVVTILFLLVLLLPALWQDIRELRRPDGQGWLPASEFIKAVKGTDTPDRPIAKRLKSFESSLEQHFEMAVPARRMAQETLLQTLQLGNEKTVIGQDGWLFYRPELKALTSYGPLMPEPISVAKDPSVGDWRQPLPVIKEFGRQLKERGVELWLVPVPMKESIYPDKLTGNVHKGPVLHADEEKFFREISGDGVVQIVRLDQLFWDLKKSDATDGPVYLKQDTHWTPRAMQAAASLLADRLRKTNLLPATPAEFQKKSIVRSSLGDLVEKLDLPQQQSFFKPENFAITAVLDPASGKPVQADPTSPIVVLGDSFVNIFHDPGLGFEDPASSELIGAGLAQHLMAAAHAPVDVIAINGGAASSVREQFARRPDNEVRSKKVVLWLIAARDLHLSRGEAIASQVEWRSVEFNPNQSKPQAPQTSGAAQEIVVEATVEAVSQTPADPTKANYSDAVFSVKYRVNKVISGKLESNELLVYHWLFKRRQFVPTSEVAVGKSYQLKLQPWTANLEAFSKTILDDFDALEVYYSETATPAP